jgi:hypothetical protein
MISECLYMTAVQHIAETSHANGSIATCGHDCFIASNVGTRHSHADIAMLQCSKKYPSDEEM